jgi:hypothetical protein
VTVLITRVQKLKRERSTWAAMNHPNILPLFGFADDHETFQPFGALVSPVNPSLFLPAIEIGFEAYPVASARRRFEFSRGAWNINDHRATD